MRHILILMVAFFCMVSNSNAQLQEGFESVINLDPPDESGLVVPSGWLGFLRSEPPGFTGVFQGVPPDGMGNGGGFLAHEGPDNSYMGVSFTSAGSFTINDVISTWMVSPVVQLEDGGVFSFYTRTVPESLFPDSLYVRMSTNGGSADVGGGASSIGDFTTELFAINPLLMPGEYPEEWTKFEIELSGIGEPVFGRIALHYFVPDLSMNANAVGIDTLTYEGPLKCMAGDINQDDEINLLDVQPFVSLIAEEEFQCEGDLNGDGAVNLLDVSPFVDLLVTQ